MQWSALAVAAVLVVGGVVGGLAWWVGQDSRGQASGPNSTGAQSATPSAGLSDSPNADPSATTGASDDPGALTTVTTTRVVSVAGDMVTVEERSEVSGGTTEATPVTATPLGLALVSVTTVGGDGRTQAFDEPVALSPAGSLTVRSRYRVTDCPALLPPAWPTPVDFADSTRAYVRVDEPLHTARALCPGQDSSARPLDGLSGALVPDDSDAGVPAVRLRWEGSGSMRVTAVGSASGVAALPVELGCGGGCVAELAPGGSATLTLQPIDPCPPATDDDTLTLQREGGDVVTVTVKGLHRAVCRD